MRGSGAYVRRSCKLEDGRLDITANERYLVKENLLGSLRCVDVEASRVLGGGETVPGRLSSDLFPPSQRSSICLLNLASVHIAKNRFIAYPPTATPTRHAVVCTFARKPSSLMSFHNADNTISKKENRNTENNK